MRKKLTYILVVLAVLLSACSEESTNPDKKIEVSEPVESNDEAISGDEEIEEEEEEEEEKELIEEQIVEKALYELNASWALVPIDDANPKAVLLTIDDAPDKRALNMAKTLKELDAPAIFFVNGHFIDSDEEKEILKEIHEMGFAIGNHTKTHANLKQSSEEQQQDEILSVSNTIEEVIGERPLFFRAPFGINTDFSKELVKKEGMLLMNWSYGYDWEKNYMDDDALADIMVNTELLGNGSNLLMHDRQWTADALAAIVGGLRAKGYELINPATIKGVE